MKIDYKNWMTFRFCDIFLILKGFYNKKPEASDKGTIPFIGATDSNNGATSYHTIEDIEMASKTGDENNTPIDQKIFPAHAVCVTNDGSIGYAYYQPIQFTCSHSVTPLYRKDGVPFNPKTGLFVATVIMQDRYRWQYGRKWRPSRMINSTIDLPATKDGCPDWDFMETYIESLKYKPITSKILKPNVILSTHNWEEFFLHELFNTSMGNGIDAINTTSDDPKFNYVSRGSDKNGVAGFVDELEEHKPFPAGVITLALGGSVGACFVQKEPFYTAQNVAVLQEKEPMSIYSKLFIITLIRNECKIKYQAFGRELNAHFRKDFIIKLPVLQANGKNIISKEKTYSNKGFIPDWEFIDTFMKSLPYSDRIE